jgi:hypothetical protein
MDDALHCNTTLTVNENDNSAAINISLCNVCYRTMQTISNDPAEWVNYLVKNSIESRAMDICNREIENHLKNGTMPANVSKQSLILNHKIDETHVNYKPS